MVPILFFWEAKKFLESTTSTAATAEDSKTKPVEVKNGRLGFFPTILSLGSLEGRKCLCRRDLSQCRSSNYVFVLQLKLIFLCMFVVFREHSSLYVALLISLFCLSTMTTEELRLKRMGRKSTVNVK